MRKSEEESANGKTGYLAQVSECAKRCEQLRSEAARIDRELAELEEAEQCLELSESQRRLERINPDLEEPRDRIGEVEDHCAPLETQQDVPNETEESWQILKERIALIARRGHLADSQSENLLNFVELIRKYLEALISSYCKQADEQRQVDDADNVTPVLDLIVADLGALIDAAQVSTIEE